MIVAYIYIYMLLVTIGSYHYYSYSTIYMSYIYILIMSQSYIGTIGRSLKENQCGPGLAQEEPPPLALGLKVTLEGSQR